MPLSDATRPSDEDPIETAWRVGPPPRRVPLIFQAEAAECGLACVAMIAGALGLEIDLTMLRQQYSLSLKGANAAELLRVGERLQLEGRGLRAEPEHLRDLNLPCVLHWDLNHFVVLVRCDGRTATIHDPASGRRTMPLGELSKHFTGVVLEWRRRPEFRPGRRRERLSLDRLLGPVPGLRRALVQVLLLALLLEFFVLLTPFFLQFVVDEVLISADRELLLALGLAFTLLVLFQAATTWLRAWAVLLISAQLNLHWLLNVFGHLLRLPMGWFEKRQLGDVWSRYGSVQAIQRTLTTSFVEAVLDGVMVLLTLVMLALYSAKLLAVALVATALYGALRWVFYGPLRQSSEEALTFEARQNGHLVETLRGMQAIKLFNAESRRSAVFADRVTDTMNAQLATRRIEALFAVLHRLLFGLERVAVIWLGAVLVLDRQLSVGMLLAFFAYKEQFSLRVAALIDKSVDLAMLRLQGERLADITTSATEPVGPSSATTLSAPPAIELRDVRFRYGDGEPEVLRGVSFALAAGESVVLVGPSGSGKSTLVKILLGLESPTAGEVLINGRPLDRMGLPSWREAVGVVMQDDQLFSGSIAANIAFFALDADPARIEDSARRAGIHDDVVAMPMGYQTLIGDMGSALSGGQRQRILLARALYKRPQVLVLDEATSALDVATERAVNEAMRSLALTRIVVAHRPETIAAVGRVIVLNEGRVAPPAKGDSTGPADPAS